MRIAFLNPVGILGGAERLLLSLLESLRQSGSGAELHLLAAAGGPLIRRAEQLGIRSRVLPMPATLSALGDSALRGRNRVAAGLSLAGHALVAAPALCAYLRRLTRALQDTRADVVHSNGIKTHLLLHLARWDRCPVVWHLHDFVSRRPLMGKVLRWASRSAAGAIAISQAVAEDARSSLPGLPLEVVPNGVDVRRFSPGPQECGLLDGRAGLPPAGPGVVRVGLVATYARWKGQDVFLRAARHIAATRPEAPIRFYLVGSPIYGTRGSQFSGEELRALASSLGVADRVGFVPFQEDPADVYRALDVVVHASTMPEPFGLTIAEAMACGRPVVVSRAGGAAELFTHNEDALGVAPGDVEALAAAILRLAHSPGDRQRLAAEARRTAVRQFSQERLAHQLIAAYRQLGIRCALRIPDQGMIVRETVSWTKCHFGP